jgi:hypothetical protein
MAGRGRQAFDPDRAIIERKQNLKKKLANIKLKCVARQRERGETKGG